MSIYSYNDYVCSVPTTGLRDFATKNQRRLKEFIQDAHQWDRASAIAADERRSDWDLVQHLASQSCGCGNGLCQWWQAAEEFFERNQATIDRKELAASLARIICQGPTKTSRVPLIVGATNAAKSTVLKPVIKVFGFGNVAHHIGSEQPLTNS